MNPRHRSKRSTFAVILAGCLSQICSGAELPEARSDFWRRDDRVCGVNAAYVLLKACGCDVDYAELKDELLPASESRQTTLSQIQDAVSNRDLRVRAIRTDLRHLDKISLPAIAHVTQERPTGFLAGERGHYITIIEVDGGQLRYVDGTSGRIKSQTEARFFRIWSGYLLVLESGTDTFHRFALPLCVLFATGACWCCIRSVRGRFRANRVGIQPGQTPSGPLAGPRTDET